jgi:hypothetical protein
MSVRGDGEWVLVHRCVGCDEVHLNRTAGDDNPLMLMRVAVRPLAGRRSRSSFSRSCEGLARTGPGRPVAGDLSRATDRHRREYLSWEA